MLNRTKPKEKERKIFYEMERRKNLEMVSFQTVDSRL